MGNILNIPAALIAFLMSASLAFGLWTPVMSFLDYFASAAIGLYIMCGAIWVAMIFLGVTFLPFSLMVAND